jgi:DNA-binding PadR family transcriptional regulator
MYGYEMIKELQRRSDGVISLGQGTLYPSLHRLQRAGLIQGRWRSPDNGLNSRCYYSTTAKGTRWLREQSRNWSRFSTAVDRVLQAG